VDKITIKMEKVRLKKGKHTIPDDFKIEFGEMVMEVSDEVKEQMEEILTKEIEDEQFEKFETLLENNKIYDDDLKNIIEMEKEERS